MTAPADSTHRVRQRGDGVGVASDNVGVTSIQFKLDGVNLGAADHESSPIAGYHRPAAMLADRVAS
jgi:hypothetical protein